MFFLDIIDFLVKFIKDLLTFDAIILIGQVTNQVLKLFFPFTMTKADTIHKNLKNPVDKKLPRKLLLRAIRQKYDTLDELGAALGITKQSVSDAINRQTDKFMQRLADKAGIHLNAICNPISIDNKLGKIKKDIESNSDCDNNALEDIEELKKDLKQKRNYINLLEKENIELRKLVSKNRELKLKGKSEH